MMHYPDKAICESIFEAPIPPVPRPPSPSTDAGIFAEPRGHPPGSDSLQEPDILDVFTLKPLAALKILCGSIETLVRITGDIPPTPPVTQPPTPHLGLIGTSNENVALHAPEGGSQGGSQGLSPGAGDDDGVPSRAKTPIGSPEAHPTELLHVIGANTEPLSIQHGAIARKFYSKKPPPISLEEYLLRLHKFCPMSTAVYLATSLYIHRLAVTERIIPVTTRNVHRLLLAGLRVAMKALEDQSYPHRRFAKVGGVSEPELGRLEVSFCFVTNFELKVDKEMLLEHAKAMTGQTMMYQFPIQFGSQLPRSKQNLTMVVEQTKPSGMVTKEAPAAA